MKPSQDGISLRLGSGLFPFCLTGTWAVSSNHTKMDPVDPGRTQVGFASERYHSLILLHPRAWEAFYKTLNGTCTANPRLWILLQLKGGTFITCPNPNPGRPGVMGVTLGQKREWGPLSHIHSGGETAAQHPTASSRDFKDWGSLGEVSSLAQHLPWKVRFP